MQTDYLKKIFLLFVFLCFSFFASADELLYSRAPSALPYVTSDMETAGFWVSRHPSADQVIMNKTEIAEFNGANQAEGLVSDLTQIPEIYDGKKVKEEILTIASNLKEQKLFNKNGVSVNEKYYENIALRMGVEDIPSEITPKFGFIIKFTDERLLPTGEGLYAKAGDVDFDELQNSGLGINEPVVILHASKDGEWLFVKDKIASGWIQADRVVAVDRDVFLAKFKSKTAIVIEPKADIYLDRHLTQYYGSVRMGTNLILKNKVRDVVEILLASRRKDGAAEFVSGFVSAKDVTFDFLPMKPRLIYQQAFKMLDKPYGWGDMHNRQDCSRFIQMVLSVFGLEMPRNSKDQAKTGRMLASFNDITPSSEKLKIIMNSPAGITLLRLKGHIMLYLGQMDGRPYAIHAAWGYREPISDGERVRIIGKVAVSDLSLGEDSAKGSLLERTIDVRILQK